jgi:hypothetical protein
MNYWEKILNIHNIKYSIENIRYLQEYKFRKNNGININLKSKYQTGGSKYKFRFKDFEVTICSTEDNHSIIYSLNSNSECLLIDIDKEQKNIATIIGISADYGCFDDNKKRMKGSDLLDLAIKFIETKRNFKTENGEILKVKKIQLTDNSHITCNNKKIKLSNLYTLCNGHTWYMSRGFMPIGINDKETMELINGITKNYNIMRHLTIEKSKINDYITNIPKTKENINTINNILFFIKNNEKKLLKELFKEIKNNFIKYCSIIDYLTEIFYKKIGLESFYKETFILKI